MQGPLLVTGGAGFIGSHLVDKLCAEGRDVVVADNFDDFYPRALKERNIKGALASGRCLLEEGDIRDGAFLRRVFGARKFDAVVHLAAKTGVRPSIAAPLLYEEVNVRGTMNVLEAMREAGVGRMVFASSSSVYGDHPESPFRETARLDRPVSPYAATKLAAEHVCHVYHHIHGMDIFCLRLFTVYGPRQRPDLAIHKFARLILDGKPVPLFGDGTTERDYTHVSDIVDGIRAAIDKAKGFDVLNLGNSRPAPLAELLRIIEDAVGRRAEVRELPEQPGDARKTFADISRAGEILGYRPRVGIEVGARDFVEWLRKEKA